MRLKEIREDNDIKQKEIAEFLHIKQNTYSQYENGQRQIPIDMLIQLSNYYDTSVDYLLGLTKIKERYPEWIYQKENKTGCKITITVKTARILLRYVPKIAHRFYVTL